MRIVGVGLLGLAVAACGSASAGERSSSGSAGDRLGATIERAIKGEGPFFTAAERATIEAKCGYAPGSWDGYEANVTNGVFVCRDGRKIDDSEMRALLAVAEPRIEKRVKAAMENPEIKAAIAAVAEEAEREALKAVDAAKIAAHAAREAEAAAREAAAEARRAAKAR